MDRENMLRTIIGHYGQEPQKLKAIEELTELQELVIKNANKGLLPDMDDLYSEMADVLIMLFQLQMIYGMDPACIETEIDHKLCRTIDRINKESQPDCGWQ